MENLQIYNSVRDVPLTAQRKIEAGRLKGKTDINPMWRIKALTEQFGPCGIGWKINITKQWIEQGANDEVSAFCNVELFIKVDDKWSEPICGTGGSSFIAKEKGGLYTSDECFKMAYTDAISVACKMLGFGADIYWNNDKTKYDTKDQENKETQVPPPKYDYGKMTVGQASEMTAMQGDKEVKFGDLSVGQLRQLLKVENHPEWVEAAQILLDVYASQGGETK